MIREEDVGIGKMCSVLRVYALNKAQWLSWLERRPVTAEVVGSSPIRVAIYAVVAQSVEYFLGKEEVSSSNLPNSSICTISSVGRAPDS